MTWSCSDVSLPGIDGFEVLRQLRRDNHSGSILILTAHDARPIASADATSEPTTRHQALFASRT